MPVLAPLSVVFAEQRWRIERKLNGSVRRIMEARRMNRPDGDMVCTTRGHITGWQGSTYGKMSNGYEHELEVEGN